jgi:class 3 adenylate cyclase/Tfp pilus assembly protein PilF
LTVKRKIAALLAADIAGYSRLIAEDEEETLRRLRDYQGAFTGYIERAGGRVFKTAGDSILAEFPSAVDALRCAIEVQESLRSRNLAYPMSRQMAYRVGLTIGDVVEQDGDLLGDGVNIAARLESLAQPGGICISKGMHDAVSNKLSAKYVDMGSHQVKNMPVPVHVFSVSADARGPLQAGQPDAATAAEQPQQHSRKSWNSPPLAVSAAGVALVSALAVYMLPRLLAPAAPQPTMATSPAVQNDKQPPAVATNSAGKETEAAVQPPPQSAQPANAASNPVSEPAPHVTPLHEAAAAPQPGTAVPVTPGVAAAAKVGGGDDAALERLRALRWKACTSDDTSSALAACKVLIAEATTKGEDLALAHRKLGYAQRKHGEPEAALASFSESIKAFPTADAFNNRGVTYFLNGQFKEAIADYDEAIRLDANSGDAWNNRAWTNYKSGRPKDALADADKAVSVTGDKAYVWDTRGHIYEALGNLKSATADFEKALSLDPNLDSSKAGLKRVAGK